MRKFKLDLRNHCVETEIKRIYERLIFKFFKAKSAEEQRIIGKDIELFERLFRKRIDFSRLRSSHPLLSGGCEDDVFLIFDKNEVTLCFANVKVNIYDFC